MTGREQALEVSEDVVRVLCGHYLRGGMPTSILTERAFDLLKIIARLRDQNERQAKMIAALRTVLEVAEAHRDIEDRHYESLTSADKRLYAAATHARKVYCND